MGSERDLRKHVQLSGFPQVGPVPFSSYPNHLELMAIDLEGVGILYAMNGKCI